jgi:hypothetical protein
VIHPERICPDGSITTFSNIKVGDQIMLLIGDPESLIGRARRVTHGALLDISSDVSRVRFALVIFCAGCFLAIKDRVDEIWRELSAELPGVPLLGQFTFGEQGVFPDGKVAHGNLMVSVTLWCDPAPAEPWFEESTKSIELQR